MKKYILAAISLLSLILATVAIICAITVTGSGFLDLSNIARYLLAGIAVLLLIVTAIAGKAARATK